MIVFLFDYYYSSLCRIFNCRITHHASSIRLLSFWRERKRKCVVDLKKYESYFRFLPNEKKKLPHSKDISKLLLHSLSICEIKWNGMEWNVLVPVAIVLLQILFLLFQRHFQTIQNEIVLKKYLRFFFQTYFHLQMRWFCGCNCNAIVSSSANSDNTRHINFHSFDAFFMQFDFQLSAKQSLSSVQNWQCFQN